MKNLTKTLKSFRGCLLLLTTVLISSDLLAQTASINWDVSTRKFVTNGGYARAIKISTGELVLAYGEGPGTHIKKSSNNGATWGNPILVAQTNGYNNANAEITQLANGWLLYSWNGRPQRDGTLPYTIKTKISRDNGNTWGDERTIYSGDVVFSNGVWEPITLQIPSGEVQIYFANESPYRNSGEQEITIMRSLDNGLSWGSAKAASFRAGSRDGMSVPVYLKNNRGIAMAIEDPGINGNFKPVIVWSSTADNWRQPAIPGNSPSRWHALRPDNQIAAPTYAGAPYLVQLPSGETLLSIQSAEGRANNEVPIMQVYVGDGDAKNFANKSTPFTNIPGTGTGLWNALTVIDDNTVMAISSVNGVGQNGVWTIIGRVVRPEAATLPTSGFYQIINQSSNKCMDVAGVSAANGAAVQIWDCLPNQLNQQWQFVATDSGYYRIIARHSNKALDVAGISALNGALLNQWDWLNGQNQQWKAVDVGGGYYKFIARHSGRAIDVLNCIRDNGTQLQQWDDLNNSCQAFRLVVANTNNDLNVTIQAENFAVANAVENQSTSDAGGGLNVGWIDNGDWMSYTNNPVTIPSSGTYTIEYRVASLNGGGSLRFEEASGSPLYGTLGIPRTGGWQNWVTISHNVNLPAGAHRFGINAASGGWNINWFRITKTK